jgi:hypothetical protein
MAAVAKHPKRNILLQPSARVIKNHGGEPKPETATDPNLKNWSVHLIGGRKVQHLGFVQPDGGRPRSRSRSRSSR